MKMTDKAWDSIQEALKMLGQAQECFKPESATWTQIGKAWEELDSLGASINDDEEGYYAEQINSEVRQ